MTDKPPWIALDARDRQDMVDWVNARLNEGGGRRGLSPEHAARFAPEAIAASVKRYQKWRQEGGSELELAQHGDIEPARELVRKVFPLLADLLQPPKLKRGEKYLPYTIGEGVIHRSGVPYEKLLREVEDRKLIAAAVADMQRIKLIWRRKYGKSYRRGNQVSAIEIAAERNGVSVKDVAERLKRAK